MAKIGDTTVTLPATSKLNQSQLVKKTTSGVGAVSRAVSLLTQVQTAKDALRKVAAIMESIETENNVSPGTTAAVVQKIKDLEGLTSETVKFCAIVALLTKEGAPERKLLEVPGPVDETEYL
jgi:hypothetical protein